MNNEQKYHDGLIDDINSLQNENKKMIDIIRQFVAVWDIASENKDYIYQKNNLIDKTWHCYIKANELLRIINER